MTRSEQSTDVNDAFTDRLAADSRERAVGALLRIPRLRRLWTAQFIGSTADRLALLVLIVLAVQAAAVDQSFGGGYRGAAIAVAAVFGARLLATLLFGAVLLGPISALTAPGGGLDRRWTMIGCDVLRLALMIVAPLWINWTEASVLRWVLATAFAVGAAERIWTVARDNAAPALLPVPASQLAPAPALPAASAPAPAPAPAAAEPDATMRLPKAEAADRADAAAGTKKPVPTTARPAAEHLEALRRLDLRTSYGTLPVAAAALVVITLVNNLLAAAVDWFRIHQIALASCASAGLFAASITVLYLLDLPNTAGPRPRSPLQGLRRPKDSLPGEAGKGRTGAVPILVISTAVTCAAVAAAFALAVLQAFDLGGGPVAFGLLALALSGGPVLGVRVAPRVLPALSRRRLLALSIAVTGLALLLVGLVPDPTSVLLLALLAGTALGVAAHTSHTLLDHEADEASRGRVGEHLHAVVRVFVALAAVGGPLLAGAIGPHRLVKGAFIFAHGGAAFTLMLAGALLLPVAVLVLGRIDDRQGVPLGRDLRDALRGGSEPEQRPAESGYFIAVEGGDGAGKSTQVEALAEWIRGKGHEVVVTREPGATAVGKRLRAILLDVSNTGISHRAEALLYAADRAEHVDSVIRPALERGAIVISDRYVDSSVAYQGAGRDLSPTEVARISRWATGGLVPHLTVLLDVSPEVARERFTEAPDRLESEPAEFHQRVRSGFLALAAADPARYLVVDAGQEPEAVATTVRHRLDRELPLSEQEIRAREEAERKAAEEARKRAEEEARRKEEEERREKKRQEQLARLRAEEEARRRAEEEEARRREEERAAEEARLRAEEARRQAEEEARRRAAEEDVRRQEEEARRRQAAEEARLRSEAEERRAEKQRRAEEALMRAEEARREAEGSLPAAPGGEATQTVEPPAAQAQRPPADAAGSDDSTAPDGSSGSGDSGDASVDRSGAPANDSTQTIEAPRPQAPDADETAVLPPVSDSGAEDETRQLPQASEDPAARVPPWMWRPEDTDAQHPGAPGPDAPRGGDQRPGARRRPDPHAAERTRELPQMGEGEAGQSSPGRRGRPRSDWAEETPLDDLPTLADELLGPREDRDDRGHGSGGDPDQGGRRGRRGRK